MTPREKAIELVAEFNYITSAAYTPSAAYQQAKKCAMLAVDEIIEALDHCGIKSHYWMAIKSEIQKL